MDLNFYGTEQAVAELFVFVRLLLLSEKIMGFSVFVFCCVLFIFLKKCVYLKRMGLRCQKSTNQYQYFLIKFDTPLFSQICIYEVGYCYRDDPIGFRRSFASSN